MSDEAARLERMRAALASLREPGADAGSCGSAEEIWGAGRGELPAEHAARLLDHSLSCPACAEAWRLAAELETGDAPVETVTRTGRRWGLAAAAAAVLAVILWLSPWSPSGSGDAAEFRTDESVPSIRSLIPEDRPLARDACVLRWRSDLEGAVYTVEVATEDATVLARQAALHEPSFTVPREALEPLPAGAKIVWRVEAVLLDGTRVDSPAFIHAIE